MQLQVEPSISCMEMDKSMKVISPLNHSKKLLHEVHSGNFGGHLRDTKIHSSADHVDRASHTLLEMVVELSDHHSSQFL